MAQQSKSKKSPVPLLLTVLLLIVVLILDQVIQPTDYLSMLLKVLQKASVYALAAVSLNLLTANETDPVVWRGPVIANVVKQFWSDVVWGEVDYMFVDMPPGTGDVPLTVFQSLPVDGVIVVTSPQDLVSMIVSKAVNMAKMMSIPLLGVIENYSYYQCPDCGAKHAIFGESRLDEVARELALPILARLPIDPTVAAAFDTGKMEAVSPNYLEEVAAQLDV